MQTHKSVSFFCSSFALVAFHNFDIDKKVTTQVRKDIIVSTYRILFLLDKNPHEELTPIGYRKTSYIYFLPTFITHIHARFFPVPI